MAARSISLSRPKPVIGDFHFGLLELMITQNVQWPENVDANYAIQSGKHGGPCMLYFYNDLPTHQKPFGFLAGTTRPVAIKVTDSASNDWETRVITREEYIKARSQ